MAEEFAFQRKAKDIEIVSAGLTCGPVHPTAVRVMSEIGADISGRNSRALTDLPSLDFDIVISLCREAARDCPMLPGNPERVNWNLPDPAAVNGDKDAELEAFRQSRDEIKRLVDDLFDRGYADALLSAKQHADLILSHISDGIIAHDMERRIFYFNRAAEKITGYKRSEVINRDCHNVFPGRFCGPHCHFCNPEERIGDIYRQQIHITAKSGEKRTINMIIKKLTDSDSREIGVLVSFRDVTREQNLAREARKLHSFSGIIGKSDEMLDIYELIRDLADSNVPVLVQGESGTGKELVAAAIHNEGSRSDRLFVPVNCGALPESLLESELFGHVKGAFTGAIRDKKGRFELADGGTIFLDEIGDIPPSMQVKLLRALQEGAFERVGSEKTIRVNVRLISATNKNLTDEIAAGRFREDLFYRLSVVPVHLPPLRERSGDIPLLVNHILKQELKNTGKKDIVIAPETMDIMISHEWPGNVRELQNWIQFALVKCRESSILPEHLPPAAGTGAEGTGNRKSKRKKKLDAAKVREALRNTGGNKVAAASRLGVSRATLYRFIDDTGITGGND